MPERPQYSEVQFGFDVRTCAPIDRRIVLSKKEMESLEVTWKGEKINIEYIMPENYFVLCRDNMKIYTYCYHDCAQYRDEEKEYPYWIGEKFRLLTEVMDVVEDSYDSEGKLINYKSVVDDKGLAHVASAAQINVLREFINARLKEYKELLDLKADQVALDATNEEVEALQLGKQDKFFIKGDGDEIVAGKVVPKVDCEGSVHAEYDSEGNVTIKHGDIVGFDQYGNRGWTSKFEVGGIGKGRYLPYGTTIREVVRLMLYGDPAYENTIYFYAADPSTITKEDDISKWLHAECEYKENIKFTMPAIDFYGKYICIAMPGQMWDALHAKRLPDQDKWLDIKDMWEKDQETYVYNRDQFKTKTLEGLGDFRLWWFENQVWVHDEQQLVLEFDSHVQKPY